MATSKRKTTLAVLRSILGPVEGSEERVASLASRSISWVKKVSAGLEPLTEEAALQLQSATGVSLDWLLGTDPNVSPTAFTPVAPIDPPAPYNLGVFEAHRAYLDEVAAATTSKGHEDTTEVIFLNDTFQESLRQRDEGVIDMARRLLEEAEVRDKGAVLRWRLRRFLEAQEAELAQTQAPEARDVPAPL